MSFFGFGKKKVDPATDVHEQVIVPVDLDAAHAYTMPGSQKYPSPPTYGANPYATQVGKDLPTIRNQDAILVHFFQPPAAGPPQFWYNDRNSEKLRIGRSEELFVTKAPVEHAESAPDVVNPWHSTPHNPRVTGTLAQSNYRFIRAFDQRWERTNNGNVGSMATVGRSYPVGGMVAPRNLRNTLRLEPAARDTENYDLNATQTYAPPAAVYVSPDVNTGRRYGL